MEHAFVKEIKTKYKEDSSMNPSTAQIQSALIALTSFVVGVKNLM